jgi:hypothetical protein
METIMKALENFENLIYKILVWIVLIPKTLLQIVLHPDWAAPYIKQELGEGKARFDEYFSPVVLLLLVALLPFLAWSFLPVSGVEITSPATANPSKERTIEFYANIRFISTSTDGFVTTFWRVEKEFFDGTSYYYPVVYHDRYTNNPAETDPNAYFNYRQIDTHTIQGFYYVVFPEAGNYWVVVDASKFDSNGNLIETYNSFINVYVPPEYSQENVIVYARTKPDQTKPLIESLGTQLKSEKTIFLALGLLIPPLLFTLAIKMLSKGPVGEDSLKETFYVQCYFFAPIAFIFWATRYAIQLFTPDVFFLYDTDLNLIALLPMFLAVFWFISVQTHTVSREANISGGLALLVVLVCMFFLGAGISFVALNDQPDLQDVARKSSIWLYPLLAVGLLTAYHILLILQRRKEKLAIPTGDKVLAGGIVFIISVTMCLVLFVGGRATPLASADFDATQQADASQAMDQFTIFESKKFFTEEFDENLNAWDVFPWGDASDWSYSVDSGRLHVQLQQQEQPTSSGLYFMNNSFLYTDVQVETAVMNAASNPHGVSLVCRSSYTGWYEFYISNFGFYIIYASDYKSFTELSSGEIPAAAMGEFENTYTAICQGNELKLSVNNTLVGSVQDSQFNFAEGQIGIAVYSEEGLPVEVDFEYVRMSAPAAIEKTSQAVATGAASDTTAAAVQATEAPPADSPATGADPYYTEEFDGDLSSWIPYTAIGEESQVSMSAEDGKLVFQLSLLDGNIAAHYLYNLDFTYANVRMDLVTTNNGNNSNAVILVCHSTDSGQYEFDISNSGIYAIYAVDAEFNYTKLASGTSAAIKSGLSTNVYTGVCKGNELSLYVNGELVETILDTTFNFGEGNIGIGVSAFQALPVEVSIDTLTVSEP